MKPYETPMDDLRQVMHEHLEPVEVRPAMGKCSAHYENVSRRWVASIQRKWRVQDGEPREEHYYYQPGANEAWLPDLPAVVEGSMSCLASTSLTFVPSKGRVVRLRDEWRDLPIIDTKDA